MFFVWLDDLMEVSNFIHTAALRMFFVNKYSKEQWLAWKGEERNETCEK